MHTSVFESPHVDCIVALREPVRFLECFKFWPILLLEHREEVGHHPGVAEAAVGTVFGMVEYFVRLHRLRRWNVRISTNPGAHSGHGEVFTARAQVVGDDFWCGTERQGPSSLHNKGNGIGQLNEAIVELAPVAINPKCAGYSVTRSF
mmetsp:Transcript_63854/g.144052  ORF Transcript_63854/g.144052 Transcript_63854/m.144052 type:complete len:148 (-) Transcript_63854:76-519(-)